MASSSEESIEHDEEIRLWRDERWWIAKDVTTGVTTQGESRDAALANLDEALEGYHGEGEPPTEEDLRRVGIDPDKNVSGSLDDSGIFE